MCVRRARRTPTYAGSMPLSVICGPPNSGRATEILERFKAVAGADPVLVVPTRDDVVRFEREAGNLLGGAVTTFAALFGDVARATGASSAPPLSAVQRLGLIREAISRTPLRTLGDLAPSRGLPSAVDRLLDELQASAVEPERLDAGPHERDLGAIYAAYRDLCREHGLSDEHDRAAAAISELRRNPDAWGRRPLLLYGFDDLTPEQLELLGALSGAAEVTVAVTYEDRNALAARSRLLAQLRDQLGGTVEKPLAPEDSYTGSPVLRHLSRRLFEPGASKVVPDDGLELLEAAGIRSEAEAIAAAIARLLADGVAPGEVAVVLRQPDADGPLFDRVFSRLGIPVATDARVPLSRTTLGNSLAAALRACFETNSAADVLAFLRAPGGAPAESVDWLERTILQKRLRSADEALEAWVDRGAKRPWELDALLEDGTRPQRLARLARVATSLGERPLRRSAALVDGAAALELRAAAVARRAFEELAELGDAAPELSGIGRLLDEISVPLSAGPAEGRVRIVGPYRVRAARARHLFVASLQDGVFPAAGEPASLLGEERREALELPERRAQLDEERYLFHACVSRPTDCLHLSARPSDEDGRACVVSPFLDDVLDLLTEPPRTLRRGLDSVCFAPGEAPTVAELGRALATLATPDARDWAGAVSLPAEIAEPALAAAAQARELGSALPGPLRNPLVLEKLAERRRFGASTLEEYVGCSYRWFARHELSPQSLKPSPDPLTQGGIMHEVLQRLYAERPGGTPLPRPENLQGWLARSGELVVEEAAGRGLSADRGFGSRVSVARMTALIHGFLRRQSELETTLAPTPELLEASFGFEESARPALELGDFELHGSIDRIDVESAADGGAALIQDYKLGARVTPAARLAEDGKLQIQLYAIAARELWGLAPIGTVYHPLGARGTGTRARGLLAASEREALLAGANYVRTDFRESDDFDEVLAAAAARAAGVVAAMRAGEVRRRPLGGKCPTWCSYQPICRQERAVRPEDADEEEGA